MQPGGESGAGSGERWAAGAGQLASEERNLAPAGRCGQAAQQAGGCETLHPAPLAWEAGPDALQLPPALRRRAARQLALPQAQVDGRGAADRMKARRGACHRGQVVGARQAVGQAQRQHLQAAHRSWCEAGARELASRTLQIVTPCWSDQQGTCLVWQLLERRGLLVLGRQGRHVLSAGRL